MVPVRLIDRSMNYHNKAKSNKVYTLPENRT